MNSLWETNKDAIVNLQILRNNQVVNCSGFFISADGYIATSAHCLLTRNENANVNNNLKHFRASKIWVDVSVGMETKAKECKIVGIDGAGDIALLKTETKDQTFLEFTNSHLSKIGEDCFILGNPLAVDVQSISNGNIRDNKFYHPNVLVETMLVSASAYKGNSGSPILNSDGEVIGMTTFSFGHDNLVGGPSSHILDHVLTSMKDTQNDYVKGFLGATFNTYNSYLRHILQIPNDDLSGFIVTNIDAKGPLNNVLSGGELVKEIDDLKMGVYQLSSPSLVTWKKAPGSSVKIDYQKSPLWSNQTVNVNLIQFPNYLDLPLYSNKLEIVL